MPQQNEILKRSIELQHEELNTSLQIETDKILLAREDNTFKEAKLFSQRQISDFKLNQAENPSSDPTSAVEGFSNELLDSLKDRFDEMGDYNAEALKTELHSSVNGLRLGAINQTKEIEKERAKELSASLMSDIEDASTSGNLNAVGSKFSDLLSHLDDMQIQGQITGEEKFKIRAKVESKVYGAQTDSVLTDSLLLESEGDHEGALQHLKNGLASISDAPSSFKKKIATRIKTLTKEINELGKEGVDSTKERFNKVRSNFFNDPKYLPNITFEAKRYIEKLQASKTSKNKEDVERKIEEVTAQYDVVQYFSQNPEHLGSSVEVDKLIDNLDKQFKGDKNSSYWASFVNEVYTYKSRFNTENRENTEKTKKWIDKVKQGQEDSSRDIASSSRSQSQFLDPSKYTEGKSQEVAKVFDFVKDEIFEAQGVYELYESKDGHKTLQLSEKAEASVIDYMKAFVLSGDIDSASNLNGFLNDNDVTLRESVSDSIFSTQGSFASILRQFSKFGTVPSQEGQVLNQNAMRGLALLTSKEEGREKADTVKLYNSALKSIKSDHSLLRSIKDVAGDVDGGAKYLALATLGYLKDNIGLKSYLTSGASIGEMLEKNEDLRVLFEEYQDSAVKVGESMILKRDGEYDQGALASLNLSDDNSIGVAAEVMANSLNSPNFTSLRTQSGLKFGTDLNLKGTMLSLIKLAYPGQDFSIRSLEKGNFLFREEENGNFVLYRANEDGSPARPVQINGRPVYTTTKRMAVYNKWLKDVFKGKQEGKGVDVENVVASKYKKISKVLGPVFLNKLYKTYKAGEKISHVWEHYSNKGKKNKLDKSLFDSGAYLFGASLDEDTKNAISNSNLLQTSIKEAEVHHNEGFFGYIYYRIKEAAKNNENIKELLEVING